MKKLPFLLLTFLFCACLAQAQIPGTASRQDSAIKLNVAGYGRNSSAFYTINNEPVTNATIKRLLKSYPKSAVEVQKYKSQQRLAFILMVPVAVTGLIVGVIQAKSHDDAPGSAFSKAPIPFSVYLGSLVGGAIIAGKNDHYGKAIEAYNSRFK
ncbi:hypothetical protein [Hymenobacter sp. BRD67]|uniref:hypothetical protein n=1 Tax=Hymenobacter sp. BRD67 TaxID=2675877 RepID=UPI00156666D5|nr:hypothetical protein [Hymenobacter sp. BRD67]QKG52789.1 hypothetical protein GKZ67_09490 [Hymenobacter sp. BRD67]